jgi:hypothetical protein
MTGWQELAAIRALWIFFCQVRCVLLLEVQGPVAGCKLSALAVPLPGGALNADSRVNAAGVLIASGIASGLMTASRTNGTW